MIQTATDSWNRMDFQPAIEMFERAAQLDPANSNLHLDLGRMYGLRYNYAAAESSFEKAVRLAQRKTLALTIAGRNCRDFGDYAMAERFFKRALAEKDAAPEMFVELARLYERLRRPEEAAEQVARALRLNSGCSVALLTRARLDRQAGRLEAAEQGLRSFIAKPDPDTWTQAQAWYELGGILDRQAKYDEAMAAFLAAKELLRPHAANPMAALQTVRTRLKHMRENISSDMLQRWLDAGAALQPPRRLAFLGGHPRSGTTPLEQVLDSHPDVVSAEETLIFNEDAYIPLQRHLEEGALMLPVLELAQTSALQQSRENYFRSVEGFLRQPIGGRLLIDKNPSLTILLPALLRVFPEIKLLIALRDPRDVCLSCFMQPLRLSQAASAFLSLEGTVEEYVSVMGIWRTIAPLLRTPYLEVRYEDLVDDLEATSRRTLEFLGVPWDARVLRFDEHARQKLVRSPTYADVTKPVSKRAMGRWRNYQKYLEPHLDKLAPFAKAFGYD